MVKIKLFTAILLLLSVMASCGKREVVVELTPGFAAKVNAYDQLGEFSDGYAAVCKNEKWGYINHKGDEIIPCTYESALPFNENLAPVCKGGKWGYINLKGEVVIPFKYDVAKGFSDGMARVWYMAQGSYNCKKCYITSQGEEVLSFEVNYEYGETCLAPFSEGLACVMECNWSNEYEKPKFYFIDKTGRKVFGGQICAGYFEHEMEEMTASEEHFANLCVFKNGEVWIPAQNEQTYDITYEVYNNLGEKIRVETEEKKMRYEVYSEDAHFVEDGVRYDNYCVGITMNNVEEPTVDDESSTKWFNLFSFLNKNDENEIKVGQLTPAIYDYIPSPKFENGVMVVTLYEYAENAMTEGDGEDFLSYVTVHNAYLDMNGNDTFTQEVKDKCRRSYVRAMKKLKEEEAKWQMGLY